MMNVIFMLVLAGLGLVFYQIILKQRSERNFLRACLGAGVTEVTCMAKVQVADKLGEVLEWKP